MRGLDPEEEAPSPAGPQDTQSSDQSKSGLRKAWDDWTARPENNAALLQFGISMLQPRAPGQSVMGAFANSIGQGAEASDRNVAAQTAAADSAVNRDVKTREAGSREMTAGAYAQSVKDQAAGKSGKGSSLTLQMRQQIEFNKWLRQPSDPLSVDPVVQSLQKEFPEIKSKGDLLANPAARRRALQIFSSAGGGDSEDEGDTSGATPTAAGATPAPAPIVPPPRMYNNRQIHVDPARKVWVYEDGTPVQ
jgi:hypothetical protein